MRATNQILSGVALLALLLPVLLGAAEPAQEEAYIQTDVKYQALTVRVEKVSKDKLVVNRFAVDQGVTERLTLKGHFGVPVSGTKNKWLDLRKGDLVRVIFEPATQKVVKVNVMKWSDHPAIARTIGAQRTGKQGRVFTGWVKLTTDDTIVVRAPDEAPPGTRKGEKKMRFSRDEDTTVEKARDDWAAVKKGDRVTVHYGKGRPRPANRVVVILRGGERPLPAGLATRLYDPEFDTSVKDVDGIGEIAPGEEWRPEAAAPSSS